MHHFTPTHTHIHSATEMQMYIAYSTLLCKKETKIEVEEKTEIIHICKLGYQNNLLFFLN